MTKRNMERGSSSKERMNLQAIVGVAGIVVSIVIGGWSVRNLMQARLLSRWRHPSLDGLAGRRVALLGAVQVRRPLRLSPLGDCLWHREIIRVYKRRSWSTESDDSEMADFSVVVDGREFRIPNLPTEVHGGESMSGWEDQDFTDLIFGRRRVWIQKWLPMVPRLTVVGRVRRVGGSWEVAPDAAAGLLFTSHHPAKTALKEAVKGGLGLAGAVAGMAAIIYFATR